MPDSVFVVEVTETVSTRYLIRAADAEHAETFGESLAIESPEDGDTHCVDRVSVATALADAPHVPRGATILDAPPPATT